MLPQFYEGGPKAGNYLRLSTGLLSNSPERASDHPIQLFWFKNAMTKYVTLLTVLVALAIPLEAQVDDRDAGAVHVQMRNVMYHYQPNVAVHIRRLAGELVPKQGSIPVFDDKQSFTLSIAAAEMAITPQAMANVLNQYVFARKDAPIENISMVIEGDRLRIKGKLRDKGGIPFETLSSLSVTPEGKIRMHAEKIKALHLPAKGFMDLFGIKIADLIKTGKVNGISAEKDDLILDPAQALPPPHISGKVTEVRLEGNNIIQIFGAPAKYQWLQIPAQNYMAYRGNRLKFGKLTMENTDMVLIDPDPRDPFDFFLDHYKDQLTAGYTKTTNDFGLRVFMVDYNKLRHTTGKSRPKSVAAH